MSPLFRPGFLVVFLVAALQIFWSIVFLASRSIPETTFLAPFADINPFLLSFVLLTSASLALIGAFWPTANAFTILAILPQQIILFVGAVSSLSASLSGHFADGVERPKAFILADQGLYVLLVLVHVVAMVIIQLRDGDRINKLEKARKQLEDTSIMLSTAIANLDTVKLVARNDPPTSELPKDDTLPPSDY